jgi:hypothetical protein
MAECINAAAVFCVAKLAFLKPKKPIIREREDGFRARILDVRKDILPYAENFEEVRNQTDGKRARFADDPVDQASPCAKIGWLAEHVGNGQIIDAFDG